MNQQHTPRVAVVGAGVSGIAVAWTLKKAGIPFTVYEKAEEAGGTWRDNVYPGLKCDIPYFAYSYSFGPTTGGWDRLLAPGEEIQRQLLSVVDDNGLREHVRFGSDIVDCSWQVDRWQLTTATGEVFEAEIVVHATGWLHRPNWPDIEGLDTFDGPVLHTARWDSTVDLSGKRVGVVGSGSTGVQVVSALAERVGHLTSFQRTPQWVVPLTDSVLPSRLRRAMDRSPRIGNAFRELFWTVSGGFIGAAATKDGWQRKVFGKAVRSNLDSVSDPELKARLTPPDPPLCRRPIMSGDYYDVVQREDVSVVRGPIDRVVPEGVLSPDGTVHELDVLILATGYDAHAYMRPMAIRGTDGITLACLWKDRLQSYRTVGLPGFPNLFMIMGPFVSTSHVGVQEAAEWQAQYVVQAVQKLAEPGVVSLTPSTSATDAWMAEVEGAMDGRIWTNCDSYFLGDNPIPVQFPWTRRRFRRMLRTPDFADFDVRTEAGMRPARAEG